MKFRIQPLAKSIITSLIFTCLWFYPWQTWTGSLSWINFMIGLSLFLLPGLFFQHIIAGNNFSLKPDQITNGFALSILITGILGTIARITQTGFGFVSTGFYLVGIIGFIVFTYRQSTQRVKSVSLIPKDIWFILAFLIAMIMMIIAAKISIPSLIYEDDFTYNALLNYFQTANSYTFKFHTALNRLEIARFWIPYWPLVIALLADLSGLNGLLITGITIAPALVIISMLAVYSLARSLELPRQVAILSVTAQIASLVRLTQKDQAGILFFDNFAEDKVVAAFVLAPITFRLAIDYLDKPAHRKMYLFACAAIALTFTHPVIFGFCSLIIGLTGLLALIKDRRIKPFITLVIALSLILAIPLYIRMVEGANITEFTMTDSIASGRDHKLNPGRLTVLENELFFGISKDLTVGFPYECLFLTSMVGIFLLRRQKAASYVIASTLLLVVSIFPYTGWIIGYLSSPFQLWRLTWLMPFGIAMGTLVEIGIILIKKIPKLEKYHTVLSKMIPFCLTLILFIGTIYLLPWAKGNLGFGGRKPGFEQWYQDYIEMGGVLENVASEGDVIVGGPDRSTNDIIPSLSLEVRLVSFRNERGGNTAPIWEAMVGREKPIDERINLYEEYQVKYLLIRGEPKWMEALQESYPDRFTLIYGNRKLYLFEFNL